MYTLTLIGAAGGTSTYCDLDILALLEQPRIDLVHGEAFTGRPGTRIHTDDHNILKIRAEIRINQRDALNWANQALDKDRKLGVYHPDKTWFVAFSQVGDELPLIGNICPLLKPLHKLLDVDTADAQGLARLEAMFDLYLRVARAHELRLDEGLSNYGLSPDGTLYYLDDDTYNWDRFTSCAHTLGVHLRALRWLTPDSAAQLGQVLRQQIITHFTDPQYLTVLAEQLRHLFIAPARRPVLDALLLTLASNTPKTQVKQPLKQRYIALLADIHGNLAALDRVLAFLDQEGIRVGLVLGDVVGYGPYPAACIERLQAREFSVIKGNHDQALVTGLYQKGFSKTAQWALDWSESRISPAQRQWLADLPPVLSEENWLAVHGAPVDPTFFNAYVYEMTYERNLDALRDREIALCFHGHTHLQGVYARMQVIKDGYFNSETVDLKRFSQALVCPGSIGQPRNRKPGAQFAIYDQLEHQLYFKNLSYPLTDTLALMQRENFPSLLLDMLNGVGFG